MRNERTKDEKEKPAERTEGEGRKREKVREETKLA
jgi:hypothetical protein